jgi:hypothetical protein
LTGVSPEHWFDRLAVRRTRREVLKGAAGLTGALFGLSAAPAQAAYTDDPNACRTGCNWTAHQTYVTKSGGCFSLGVEEAVLSQVVLMGLYGFLGVTGYSGKLGALAEGSCNDGALIQQKASLYDCLQPGCNGFDPKQKGGPCDTCTATCCADPTVISGYSCCALGCACGSDTGACHGGGTPC